LLADPPLRSGPGRWASFRWGEVASTPECPDLEAEPTGVGPVPLSVRGATFAFPGSDRLALVDVSFDVPAGSGVLVTGPVGAGKTALARLLAALHEPDQGSIACEGSRGRIGYLPQGSPLFSGTAAENVALAWPTRPTDPVVAEALRLVALDGEVA